MTTSPPWDSVTSTQVEAGRYHVVSGGLCFEINKVHGGWHILGSNDATATLLQQLRVGGTYGTLKGANRRIEDILELPATKVLQSALKLTGGDKGEWATDGIEHEALLDLAENLRRLNFSTYISSGRLAVER